MRLTYAMFLLIHRKLKWVRRRNRPKTMYKVEIWKGAHYSNLGYALLKGFLYVHIVCSLTSIFLWIAQLYILDNNKKLFDAAMPELKQMCFALFGFILKKLIRVLLVSLVDSL